MSANNRLSRSLLRRARNLVLPGFQGIPIHAIIVFIYRELMREDIFLRANAIAYSFFLSLFPALLFFLTLLPYLPIEYNVFVLLKDALRGLLPEETERWIFNFIDSLNKPREGLLSFSALLALYFGSNGMLMLIKGFEKHYPRSYVQRNFIQKRMIAILLTLWLMILVILSVAITVVGREWLPLIFDRLELDRFTQIALQVLRILIVFFLYYFGIAVIYRFGPSFRHRVPFFSTGAMVSSVLSLCTTVLFTWFVQHYARYNQLYGAISAIIIFMVWLQLQAMVLLIGYELNASVRIIKDKAHLK